MITCGLILADCAYPAKKEAQSTQAVTPLASFTSGYAEVNGIQMYYEIYGAGDPLLLIHGGGSTIQSSFGRIIPSLAKDFKVIVIELQNHGRSGVRSAPETFGQDADDVFKFLQGQQIQKANLLGFSNGGHVLFELAIRHPEIINKLIIASAPFKRSGFVSGFFEGMSSTRLADMPARLKDEFLKVNPDSTRLRIMFDRDRQRMIDFVGWSDNQIKAISVPTLLINGDRDVITPEHAIEIHRLISHSRLAILPGVHGEYMGEVTTLSDEKPFFDLCTPLVKDFLHSN